MRSGVAAGFCVVETDTRRCAATDMYASINRSAISLMDLSPTGIILGATASLTSSSPAGHRPTDGCVGGGGPSSRPIERNPIRSARRYLSTMLASCRRRRRRTDGRTAGGKNTGRAWVRASGVQPRVQPKAVHVGVGMKGDWTGFGDGCAG